MARNGGGVYSLPEPPFVSGTVISSTAMNSDLSDIATALTDSLATDGQSPMVGSLRAYAGTLAAPGLNWVVDTDTGRYRPSANAMTDVCGGVAVAEFSGAGVNFPVGASIGGTPVAAIPIGGGMEWFTNTAPDGWLMQDGAAVSRTTYALLFAVIGTTYGAGDSSTTFNVPNKIGRAGVGRDASGSVLSGASALGTALGAQTFTIGQTNLPAIKPGITVTNPSFTQGVKEGTAFSFRGVNFGSDYAALTNSDAGTKDVTFGNTVAANTNVSAAFTSDLGSGTAISNVQPSLVQNFIIYAGA